MTTSTLASDARFLATHLAERWTSMWNGDHTVTRAVLAPGFRLRLGGKQGDVDTDLLRGPDQMAVYLDRYRAARPGLQFSLDGRPVVDAEGSQTFHSVFRWHAEAPGLAPRSGMDWMWVVDGDIAEVWSLTGARAFSD